MKAENIKSLLLILAAGTCSKKNINYYVTNTVSQNFTGIPVPPFQPALYK